MRLKQTARTVMLQTCCKGRPMSIKHGLPAGTNSVEDGVCHGFADFNSILNNCKNYLCQLLNVHGVKNVRLTDIYI
jgi:hypothetical protein